MDPPGEWNIPYNINYTCAFPALYMSNCLLWWRKVEHYAIMKDNFHLDKSYCTYMALNRIVGNRTIYQDSRKCMFWCIKSLPQHTHRHSYSRKRQRVKLTPCDHPASSQSSRWTSALPPLSILPCCLGNRCTSQLAPLLRKRVPANLLERLAMRVMWTGRPYIRSSVVGG